MCVCARVFVFGCMCVHMRDGTTHPTHFTPPARLTHADGCYFGDVSILLTDRRTASARAKITTQLFAIDKESLDNVLLRHEG